MRTEAMFVIASATAIRPGRRRIEQRERRALAHRHRFAPITVEVHQRHGGIGDRNLPRPDHGIARAHASHGAIADRHEKRLVGDRRETAARAARLPRP
jgi:hypothetical protein